MHKISNLSLVLAVLGLLLLDSLRDSQVLACLPLNNGTVHTRQGRRLLVKEIGADLVSLLQGSVGEELVLLEVESEGELLEASAVLNGDIGQVLQSRNVLLSHQLADGRVRGQDGQPEARNALDVGVLLLSIALLASGLAGLHRRLELARHDLSTLLNDHLLQVEVLLLQSNALGLVSLLNSFVVIVHVADGSDSVDDNLGKVGEFVVLVVLILLLFFLVLLLRGSVLLASGLPSGLSRRLNLQFENKTKS